SARDHRRVVLASPRRLRADGPDDGNSRCAREDISGLRQSRALDERVLEVEHVSASVRFRFLRADVLALLPPPALAGRLHWRGARCVPVEGAGTACDDRVADIADGLLLCYRKCAARS